MAEIKPLTYDDIVKITGGIELRDPLDVARWIGHEPTEADTARVHSMFEECEAAGCPVLVLNAAGVSLARGVPSQGERRCSKHRPRDAD